MTTHKSRTTGVVAILVAPLFLLGPAVARAQAPAQPIPDQPPGMNPPDPGAPASSDVPPPPAPPPPPPMAAPPPPPAAMTVQAPPPAPAPPAPAASKLPAYILWGAAGASLILGASFGFAALSAKSDFDDNPTYAKADSVHGRAVIADVGIGLGAILAVTGTIFFMTADHQENPGPQAINHPARSVNRASGSQARLRIAPLITPSAGGGVLSMRF